MDYKNKVKVITIIQQISYLKTKLEEFNNEYKEYIDIDKNTGVTYAQDWLDELKNITKSKIDTMKEGLKLL